jgi:hypothetical protein
MYFFDNQKRHLPHLHAEFGEFEGIFTLHDGEMIEGNLPGKQKRLVSAWMEIYRDELIANWELSISGKNAFKVEPLKWALSMVKVIDVKPELDYTLQVVLDNGKIGIFNVAPFLDKGIFQELQDKN